MYLQRQRLERKVYNDDPLDEDEIDGRRMFDIYEKLESDAYSAEFVQEMNGEGIMLLILHFVGIHVVPHLPKVGPFAQI